MREKHKVSHGLNGTGTGSGRQHGLLYLSLRHIYHPHMLVRHIILSMQL